LKTRPVAEAVTWRGRVMGSRAVCTAISPTFRAVSNDLEAADAARLLLECKNERISFDCARDDNESTETPLAGKRNKTKIRLSCWEWYSRSLWYVRSSNLLYLHHVPRDFENEGSVESKILVVWIEGTGEWENCGDGGLDVFRFLFSSPCSDHESSPYTISVISEISDLFTDWSSSKQSRSNGSVSDLWSCFWVLLGLFFLLSLLKALATRNLVFRIGPPASIGVSIISVARAGAVLSIVAVILCSSMTISAAPQMVFSEEVCFP
jgi:hypothetical protein